MSGGFSDYFVAEIADLILNLPVAMRTKWMGDKKNVTIARIDFECGDEELRMKASEDQGKHDAPIRTRKLSKEPLNFAIDGSFVNLAVDVFKQASSDSSFVNVGLLENSDSWVAFSVEHTTCIFAFARINKNV
jgi:hypothetical protein